MSNKKWISVDGNTAAANIAHKVNEVIAIYPITPSSPMGELSDLYSSKGQKNIWGTVPEVVELQSEGGASGAVHGALTTGALTTTFTSSQGLLLMIPNMYKIAGELTSTVFHVAARAVAAQALSIFGEHSDVYAARATGFAMLSSNSVQEVSDMALIATAATLESRIPFTHFFDGFRTSHEIQKIEAISDETIAAMIDNDLVRAHRMRGLDPERPSLRGTSQNPDVFFQGRETVNKYYDACPAIVQKYMDKFAGLTGRQYSLYEYFGAPDAEKVIVIMGSGAETVEETVAYLNAQGEKVGVVKVRLFRPFDKEAFIKAFPASTKKIAVLDRTKEPGSAGEPMYEDARTAFGEYFEDGLGQFSVIPKIVGGRYGLGSKEFDPGMVVAIYDNLAQDKPKNHFTVGINDDVTKTSLGYEELEIHNEGVRTAVFYGLGSDGTVGANKNSIKIIGDATDNYAQGYFVYDSKKAGTMTTSHLRFGPKPITSTYLIKKADFLACHNFSFLKKVDLLQNLKDGGTFLLASPYSSEEIWTRIPKEVQTHIIERNIQFYVVQASKIALVAGMAGRINTIMQTAFFLISDIIEKDKALELIKQYLTKTYIRKGQDVVDKNIQMVEKAAKAVEKVNHPGKLEGDEVMENAIVDHAPDFFKKVTGEIIAGRGDMIPVSAMPDDGTFPTATTKYEKRSIAEFVPTWDEELCIQCGKCSMVCPHAVIRMKAYDPKHLDGAPEGWQALDAKGKGFEGKKFTIQISPDDCTNCRACFNICPAIRKGKEKTSGDKALKMKPLAPIRDKEIAKWDHFNTIPWTDRDILNVKTTKGSQFLEPLFEFSGACAGCGETPYVKLVSQLFGDRAIIANATGCSSIYGGNLPTTPFTTREDGRGPSWSNSLFEDNAEFGFGYRLTADKLMEYGKEILAKLIDQKEAGYDAALLQKIIDNPQKTQEEIEAQRAMVQSLKDAAGAKGDEMAKEILSLADYLVTKSVWIMGGDGWAYDIGFGGLDHVLASGKNVNVLVMDTEVYSNTGGQMSKATPLGAIAKFAAGGKPIGKKDLAQMAMSYGYVYVAKVSMGYNQDQVIKALMEAEALRRTIHRDHLQPLYRPRYRHADRSGSR
jgi:pyruvate-ferredoxin/flavodoxin oxidoreductase